MGDVGVGDTARSRGQLLIITALSLAVLLSLLTLALNTAVFGGVHVAQADDSLSEERGAVQYRNAVRRGVGDLLPAANERYAEYEALEGTVANWSGLARGAYARDAVATNASMTRASFETRIVQNASGDFTDQSGNTSWTVAGNVSEASEYEMNVSDQNLATGNCTGGGGCFGLTVEGTNGSSWQMFVHDEDTDSDIDLTVETADGTTESCDTADSSASINVTDGTFEGCSFTSFRDDPDVDPPYTLRYTDANNVHGTYNLTVGGRLVPDGEEIGIDDSEGDGRYGTTGSPRLDARLVTTNVTVRYRSTSLDYRTEIRIVPAEGDDG